MGVATQISWKASASTPLNWTIPAPHTFNFAGWYHAVFLSLASALFAALGTALWLRLHSASTSQVLCRLRMPGAFAITCPPVTFAGLLALDNVRAGADPLSAQTFVLPGGTLLVVYVLTAFATHWRDFKTPAVLAMASAIPAAAVMAVFWPGSVFRGHSLLLAFAAMFGGVALSPIGEHPRVVHRAIAASLIGVSLAGPIVVAADATKVRFVPIAVALAVGMVLAAAERFLLVRLADSSASWTLKESGVFPVWVMLGLACAGVYLADGGEHPLWFGFAGLPLTLFVVAPSIYDRFEPVITGENAEVDAAALSLLKKNAYQVIGGITCLALLSLLSFVIGTTPAKDWKVGAWNASAVVMLITSGAVLIVVTLTLLIAANRPSPQAVVSATGLSTWVVCQLVLFAIAQPSGFAGMLIGIFMSVIVGLFVAEAITGNMAKLQNMPLDGPVKTIAALAGMAGGSTTLWLVSSASMIRGKPSNLAASIGFLVISVAAILLLPFLAAKSLHRSKPPRQFVPAAPLAGVLQDSFVSLLLAVFVGWLPVLVLARVGDLTSWTAAILAYAGYLSAAYVHIMRTNAEHVERVFDRAQKAAGDGEIPADRRAALEALRTHCRRQNILALIALIPLFAVALYSLATERGGFRPQTGVVGFLKGLLVS
ncbi:MAG TPA: hypothetical protein VGS19_27585 [Streptosporangiaceae bacterium]|nr:hypothetical protein [Streptosporangiaceae bacterium]